MFLISFIISVAIPVLFIILYAILNKNKFTDKHGFSFFNLLLSAVLLANTALFLPIHIGTNGGDFRACVQAFLISLYNSTQIFVTSSDFGIIKDCEALSQEAVGEWYKLWASILFVVAPALTFGFVLSLFKSLVSVFWYVCAFFKNVYIFSELNPRAIALAEDIKAKDKKAVIIFNSAVNDKSKSAIELLEAVRPLRAICFKNGIVSVNYKFHSPKREIIFFTINDDETVNLNSGLKLIERYNSRARTGVYIFSSKVESELILSSIEKGAVKVRRINEAHSLINRVLYEQGEIIFESARDNGNGEKDISALIIGMGSHGLEMLKALSWFGQMDGYNLEITAFDKEPMAEERFAAMAPDLMNDKYNGADNREDAKYRITVHSGIDATTASFVKLIQGITNASYVFVALGNDDLNISTAVMLRTYFERMGISPVIQAIVSHSEQSGALNKAKNHSGQDYRIDFIGDLKSSYAYNVIINSRLENEALRLHLKWGQEEDFWKYEYNYRSSIAAVIHKRARIKCGIPAADKALEELTAEELERIEMLEHKRWNAYMRSEGYIYSGSGDSNSRNNLGKMHHSLAAFGELSEADKFKDGNIGTK